MEVGGSGRIEQGGGRRNEGHSSLSVCLFCWNLEEQDRKKRRRRLSIVRSRSEAEAEAEATLVNFCHVIGSLSMGSIDRSIGRIGRYLLGR